VKSQRDQICTSSIAKTFIAKTFIDNPFLETSLRAEGKACHTLILKHTFILVRNANYTESSGRVICRTCRFEDRRQSSRHKRYPALQTSCQNFALKTLGLAIDADTPILGTRSTKTTDDLANQNHAPLDRAAKRRRTETSQSNASINSIEATEGTEAVGSSQQPTSDDINTSLRELQAQLKVHPQYDGPGFEDAGASAEAFGQLDADMSNAISDIIDHSERFEQYCAMGAADDEASSSSKNLVFAKTGSRMKVESLPILDNLVRTILSENCGLHNTDLSSVLADTVHTCKIVVSGHHRFDERARI